MSVATKSYAPSYASTEPPSDVATSQQSTIPGLSMIHSDQPSPRTGLKRPSPTPAVDVTQQFSVDEQDQHRSKRQKVDSKTIAEDQMEVDSSAKASNHDRQKIPDAEGSNENMQKSSEIMMDEVAADQVPERDDMSLEQLQKNMGDAFLLCRSSKTLLSLLPTLPFRAQWC